MTSIFCGQLQLPSQWSQVQVWAGPPLWLVSSLLRRQDQITMTKASLPRVFNNSYFRVVFNSRPSPFLEKDYPLADHTHVYQSVFHNGAIDWRFSIVIISGWTSCLLLFGLFYRLVRTHKTSTLEARQTKMWRKGLRNLSVVLLHPSTYNLNLTNILITHSFLLLSRVMNNETKSEYW